MMWLATAYITSLTITSLSLIMTVHSTLKARQLAYQGKPVNQELAKSEPWFRLFRYSIIPTAILFFAYFISIKP